MVMLFGMSQELQRPKFTACDRRRRRLPTCHTGTLHKKPYLGMLLMKSKRAAKNKAEGRLVKAAEKELFLVHKEHKWARFEEAFPNECEKRARFDEALGHSDNTDNSTIDSTKSATTTTSSITTTATRSEVDYERDLSLEDRGDAPSDELSEEEDEANEQEEQAEKQEKQPNPGRKNRGLLGRCNIQWIDLSASPAPKKRAVKNARDKNLAKPKKKSSGGRKCSHNRRVVFHRYDELIDDDGKKDYIYSLHEREVEEELANYDVIDKVEETVSDVGYFFTLLKQDLQAEASHRIGRLRRKEENNDKEDEVKKTPSRPNKPHVKYDTGHARPQVAV